ncbi:hypothetical protein [Paenibacillus rhizovicinus]|nr:hypothetical protein [Paenibacillus rhizovicinus]
MKHELAGKPEHTKPLIIGAAEGEAYDHPGRGEERLFGLLQGE